MQKKEEKWRWTDETPWNFTNWAEGEPTTDQRDFFYYNRNMARFIVVEIFSSQFHDGEWNDVLREEKKNALCQKDMGKGNKYYTTVFLYCSFTFYVKYMFSFIDPVVDIQPSLTTVSIEDKKNEYKALMDFLRLGDPLLQELANPSSPPPTPTQDNGEPANRGPQQFDDNSADSGGSNNANMKTWFLITLGILFHI